MPVPLLEGRSPYGATTLAQSAPRVNMSLSHQQAIMVLGRLVSCLEHGSTQAMHLIACTSQIQNSRLASREDQEARPRRSAVWLSISPSVNGSSARKSDDRSGSLTLKYPWHEASTIEPLWRTSISQVRVAALWTRAWAGSPRNRCPSSTRVWASASPHSSC